MSLAAAFLLVAVSAPPPEVPEQESYGARVQSATVSVTILRPAVLRGGSMDSSGSRDTPHFQRHKGEGRITYEFE